MSELVLIEQWGEGGGVSVLQKTAVYKTLSRDAWHPKISCKTVLEKRVEF